MPKISLFHMKRRSAWYVRWSEDFSCLVQNDGFEQLHCSEMVKQNRGQILSPWRGDIADSGMGLSYRPARLHRLPARYDNPIQYAITIVNCTISFRSGTKNLATAGLAEVRVSWNHRVERQREEGSPNPTCEDGKCSLAVWRQQLYSSQWQLKTFLYPTPPPPTHPLLLDKAENY